MKWTPKAIATARKIISEAPTLTEGYSLAGSALGTTATAIRLARAEGKLGEVTPAALDPVQAYRAKAEQSALKAAVAKMAKDIADREDQIHTLTELRRAKPLGPIKAVKKVGGKQRQGCPVMQCSDWHVEERVTWESTNGLNEYNLEIADRCIRDMADAFTWMLRDERFDCRAGVVHLGGDLISGYIHEELVEGNFLSPVEAVVWLQPRVEGMLRKIAADSNLERIDVACNDGNHGRLTNKIRVSTRTANSIEWLLYKTLAARMSDDPRFNFQIAQSEWVELNVFGRTLAFTHGDSFQYGGGVGGHFIPINRGIGRQFQGRDIHNFFMGHFHRRSDDGQISINGSAIGPTAYSMRIHAKPEPRQQSWFMIDSEKGKCISAPIWL